MSKPTPIVTLAVAAVLALSALAPASAATRHKRAAPPRPERAGRTGRHAARPARLVAGPDPGLAGAECLRVGRGLRALFVVRQRRVELTCTAQRAMNWGRAGIGPPACVLNARKISVAWLQQINMNLN